MKYFQGIKTKGDFSDTFINSKYVLDPNLFSIQPQTEAGKKVSSIVTILSIWNTMIGSSVVSIP